MLISKSKDQEVTQVMLTTNPPLNTVDDLQELEEELRNHDKKKHMVSNVCMHNISHEIFSACFSSILKDFSQKYDFLAICLKSIL